MMYRLEVDQRICDQCGDCEATLPHLLDRLVDGRLLVSGRNAEAHKDEIQQAITNCGKGALKYGIFGGWIPQE